MLFRYLNNCAPTPEKVPHYAGDVQALVEYGFDGAKVDGCGPDPNITRWAELLNATGLPLVLENCNDGASRPGVGVGPGHFCPFNTFRTTEDIAPQFLSAMRCTFVAVCCRATGILRITCVLPAPISLWGKPRTRAAPVIEAPSATQSLSR